MQHNEVLITDDGENYETQTLAAAYKSREAWDSIEPFTEPSIFTERGKLLWKEICSYYKRDEQAQEINAEQLLGQVSLKVKRKEHRLLFESVISSLDKSTVSAANAASYVLGLKRENSGLALASALAAGAEPSTIRPLLEGYEALLTRDSLEVDEVESVHGTPVGELLDESYSGDNLIQVYPDSLNTRLGGGVLRGHHIVVFARPEVGKTLLVLNMVYGFLQQGLKVLYINNEEPILDIAVRLCSRLSGMSRLEMNAKRDDAMAKVSENNYDKFWGYKLVPGNAREISKLATEIEPDVIIVDQLRNLNTVAENRVVQLEAAARSVRTLGGKHNALVVSVTQAGESAEGKSILTQADVDSSKTGIPGACDVMIGIGMTREDEEFGRRVISLPKNKPGGGDHAHFPVMISTETGIITSVA
jgi:archaellum biogenesis ATPase FlaH